MTSCQVEVAYWWTNEINNKNIGKGGFCVPFHTNALQANGGRRLNTTFQKYGLKRTQKCCQHTYTVEEEVGRGGTVIESPTAVGGDIQT